MFSNQYFAFPFFTLLALASAYFIIKVKKPEQILLSAALICAPWSGGVWITPVKFDFRLTYVFLLGALIFSLSRSYRFKNKIPVLITVPLFCFLIWITIGATQTYDSAIALGDGTITFVLNFVYLFVITRITANKLDVDYLLKSVCLGLFFTAVLAFLQYKIRFFHLGFIDGKFTTFMWWRTRSTFHHANAFGFYLMLVIPFIFREAILLIRTKNLKTGKYFIISLLLGCFAIFTTQNRGAWVGLAFGMAVIIFIDFFRKGAKKTRKTMIRVLVILCVISIFPLMRYGPRMYDRLFEGKDGFSNKAQSRLEYNVDAWKQVEKHPIMGCGYSNVRYYSSIIFTHNLYLLVLSETGYPGLIMFLLYLLGITLEGVRAMKTKNNFFISTMGSALLTTLLALFLASIPGPDYGITSQVSSHLWILTGIVISLNGINSRLIKQQKILKRKQLLQRQLAVNGNGTATQPSGLRPVQV